MLNKISGLFKKNKSHDARRKFALSYYLPRLKQIDEWVLSSNEVTNLTYDLTDKNITYLALTVSLATSQPYEKVLEVINEARNDEELKAFAVDAIRRSNFRHEADEVIHWGRRLGWYAFVRIMKPKVVVETGVEKGHGALLLCSALLKNKAEGYEGKYFGTDINPEAGYFLDGKYKEMGKILYGDSIESLMKMEEKIDLFINDSEHSASYEAREYDLIKDKLLGNAVILADNAHVTDELAKFAIRYKRKFVFFKEEPLNHWYPGAGIGISFL